MLNDDDKQILSSTLAFWENLNLDEQKYILDHVTYRTYHPGENIHGDGKDCTGILLLKKGRIRTYILSEEGREITLFLLGAGELCVLSASCLLSNITFDIYMDAEATSEVLLIDSEVLDRFSNNIYVENFMLRGAVDRFSEVMWAMEQILFLKFDQRLAIFLLDETSRNSRDIILLTHEQIAKYLGSAREVVSRMLKYFAQQGLVQLSRGQVKVLDKSALRQMISP